MPDDFYEWLDAKCPEGMDELTFLHKWVAWGIAHEYFIVVADDTM